MDKTTIAVPSALPGGLDAAIDGNGVPFFRLDVREPDEVAAGAIAGSVNIPMNRVEPASANCPRIARSS